MSPTAVRLVFSLVVYCHYSFPSPLTHSLLATLNIHSVVCGPNHRRKGVATAILQALLEKIKKDKKIKLVCLICKADLIQFYELNGFELIGPSPVVHGKDQWFEMRVRLRD